MTTRPRKHARVYIPTHFGVGGVRVTEARCRCGWHERIYQGRQKDAAAAYAFHLRELKGAHE